MKVRCATFSFLLPVLANTGSAVTPPVDEGRFLADASGSATPFARMPRAVTSFGAEVVGDWLYVLGGYFGRPHDYSREFQSDSFYRFNLIDRSTWEEFPNEFRAQSVQLVTHNGLLYRVGGMRAGNAADETSHLISLDHVAVFDPANQNWRALRPMPAPRSSHAAEVVGDTLFVVGGWHLDGDSFFATWHRDALALDLNAPDPEWRAIETPVRRRALASAAADDSLVVIGGITEEEGVTPRVDVLDTTTMHWRRGPDFPDHAFGLSAVGISGAVYASGRSGVVYRWSLDEDEWSPVANLAFPRFFHELVAANEHELLALGGTATGGRVAHVESIRPADSHHDSPRVATWTLPCPSSSKNRQGVFLRENNLYVFGGNNSVEQHDFSPENFVRDAYVINLNALQITPMAEFPVPRQSMQTAIHIASSGDSVGYAIGGFGHDGVRARAHSDIFTFDFAQGRWNRASFELPAARSQFGLVERDNALWVFGGHQFDRDRFESGFHHFLSIERCDLRDDRPKFAQTNYELPRTRRAFGGALMNGRYYLVGGIGDGFEPVVPCDAFNFELKSWEAIPAPHSTRISPELVALNGRLYLAGGSSEANDEFEPDGSLEMYDPETGKWTVIMPEIPVSPQHLRMFEIHGRLLLFSTQDADWSAVRIALIDAVD